MFPARAFSGVLLAIVLSTTFSSVSEAGDWVLYNPPYGSFDFRWTTSPNVSYVVYVWAVSPVTYQTQLISTGNYTLSTTIKDTPYPSMTAYYHGIGPVTIPDNAQNWAAVYGTVYELNSATQTATPFGALNFTHQP